MFVDLGAFVVDVGQPSSRGSGVPVLDGELWDTLKFVSVGGDKGEGGRQGLGRENNVVGADHLALRCMAFTANQSWEPAALRLAADEPARDRRCG